jgi:Beta-propeller repeat
MRTVRLRMGGASRGGHTHARTHVSGARRARGRHRAGPRLWSWTFALRSLGVGVLGLLLIAAVLSPASATTAGAAPAPSASEKQRLLDAYAQLPPSFIPNAGQLAAEQVRYYAQGPGYGLYATPDELVLSLGKKEPAALSLQFLGADPQVKVEALDRLPGRFNYLLGNDQSKWRSNLPTYGGVVYKGLWPGVEMRVYGRAGSLKYEFLVHPGASPESVSLAYRGTQGLSLDRAGNLLIKTPKGTLSDARPVSYQQIGGRRVEIPTRYALDLKSGRTGFALAAGYDPARLLVIDPELKYSTFLGGTGEETGNGIAVDKKGYAYLTGFTTSTDFPTTPDAFQPDDPHPFVDENDLGEDAFVAKLNYRGTALKYVTYIGGSGIDEGFGIAVDKEGNAYITGPTESDDFPTTPGAFDETFDGAPLNDPNNPDLCECDAFVTKLDEDGSELDYSTYLGGTGDDRTEGFGIAVDKEGNAYVTGETTSPDFPVTPGAIQTVHTDAGAAYDAFVTKLDEDGSELDYSTYLGGTGDDFGDGLALDSNGRAFVAGSTFSVDFPLKRAFDTELGGDEDAFVAKLNPRGSRLDYSTYVGGSDLDIGDGIAIDRKVNAYFTGETTSTDYPTTLGAFQESDPDPFVDADNPGEDAFVTKLDKHGKLSLSTYLGGVGLDFAKGIAVDKEDGSPYVAGETVAEDFPTTENALATELVGGADAFVTKLSADFSELVYSTYLGGSGDDFAEGIAIDKQGNLYVTGDSGDPGETDPVNFPTTPGVFSESFNGGIADAFVTKIDPD